MPIYTVELDGRQFDLEGDHPPSEAEARAAASSVAPPKQATAPPAAATRGMAEPDTATSRAPNGTLMDLIPRPEQRNRDLDRMVGGIGMAIPAGGAVTAARKTVELGPRVAESGRRMVGLSKIRAGENIAAATQAAQGATVGTEGVGQAGLRALELDATGGRLPKAVYKFMQRVTNPKYGELTFGEARDFYSNLSRLSANEFGSLNPVMQRQVGAMRQALHEALTQAAGTVGKGEQYAEGISEYAKAGRASAKWEKAKPALKNYALKAAGAAGLGGAAKAAYDFFD